MILVGHSYGGMVISGVAERIPDKIRRLVYLDGHIPEDGKTAFDLIPDLEDEYKKRSLSKQGKKWLVPPYDPTAWEYKKIPKSYISCTEHMNFHFMAQKAKLQLGWDYHELKSGHDAMITVPNELVQVLGILI